MALKTINTKAAFVAALEAADLSKGLTWTDLFNISPTLLEIIQAEGVVGSTSTKKGKSIPIVTLWDYQFTLKAKSLDEVTKVQMHTFESPPGAFEPFNAGALG